MGARTHFRTTLGRRFSEGARQLWLLIEQFDWTQAELAADIRASRPRRSSQPVTVQSISGKNYTGVVNRWLYGDRTPDRDSAVFLQERYRIDAKLWGRPPVEAFVPPAATVAA